MTFGEVRRQAMRDALAIGRRIDYSLLPERPGGDHAQRARRQLSLFAVAAAVSCRCQLKLGAAN